MKDCGIVDKYDIIDLSLVVKSMAEGKLWVSLMPEVVEPFTKEAKNKAVQMDSSQNNRARAVVVCVGLKAAIGLRLKLLLPNFRQVGLSSTNRFSLTPMMPTCGWRH